MTFNTEGDYKQHKHFAGTYNYFRVEASAGTGVFLGGLDISVGGAHTYSEGQTPMKNKVSWYVISSSISVGIGGGISIPGSVTGGIGKIFFTNENALDTPKTKIEKIKSYIKFIIPH